ncbi:MAG: low temperature requirement protein A [Eubacterium sp.]|nr:low temperature requirement protein A [Eubacterium sp.]
MLSLFKKDGEEKKVEYIELIYDLIFVYIIGRNNSIIHSIENGFIAPTAVLTYILSTLVILQVWYSTVMFINKYGENGWQENIAIFINMYLLYYMADGTRADWQAFYVRYNVAWMLILCNLALQYVIKLKKSGLAMPWVNAHIKRNILILLVQAVIVGVSIPLYHLTGIPFAPSAMVVGMLLFGLSKKANTLVAGDFSHLTERIMLYVVFTFGEMIIGIAEYFEGGFSFNTVYFSVMAFLIVVGLFVSYGFVYDNVIDREMETTGTAYMLIHVFLITALNNITVALEFMRMPEVAAIPKNIFIGVSMIVYFFFLFSTEKYAFVRCRAHLRFYVTVGVMTVIFCLLMLFLYQNAYLSIAVTVLYIYSVFAYLYQSVKRTQREAGRIADQS